MEEDTQRNQGRQEDIFDGKTKSGPGIIPLFGCLRRRNSICGIEIGGLPVERRPMLTSCYGAVSAALHST